jgi:hypothetical protein
MSNFLASRKVRLVLWILGSLIILFVVFGLGIAVGYDRAGFAAGFEKNYSHMFYGASPGGMVGLVAPPMPGAIHGVVGTVIDLGTSTISVEDQENNEQSVEVPAGTVIRQGNSNIVIGAIEIGDQLTVIGDPNEQGQVVARFIRIFPASSTLD